MSGKVPKEKRSKKIVLGFAGLASAAVVSAVGFAGATSAKPVATPGYGGNNNNHQEINTEVDLDVNGDNNVINVVINYFFG
ncbi:MAG TPA: hypothetical protein VK674_07110 [Candidatus Limnocylindria bacterium]|nr:hypothetical protein [Candidatus Limnocylindria bacterium]